jgi:hypothetical protein
VVLHDGDDVVVEARPARLALDVPPAPSFQSAEAMSSRFAGFASHAFPTCFVYGPARVATGCASSQVARPTTRVTSSTPS